MSKNVAVTHEEVEEVVYKFKRGELKVGKSGKIVINRK